MTPSESDVSESSSMVETGGVALRTTLPKNSPRLFFLESAETVGDTTAFILSADNLHSSSEKNNAHVIKMKLPLLPSALEV